MMTKKDYQAVAAAIATSARWLRVGENKARLQDVVDGCVGLTMTSFGGRAPRTLYRM